MVMARTRFRYEMHKKFGYFGASDRPNVQGCRALTPADERSPDWKPLDPERDIDAARSFKTKSGRGLYYWNDR